MIKLINNERKSAKISSMKAVGNCTIFSTDECEIQDYAHCTTYAYDKCGKDYAACFEGGYDLCENRDTDLCHGNAGHDVE